MRRRLKELRSASGLTISALAERASLSADARIEMGDRSPTLNTIDSIAKALGVSVTELLAEQDPTLWPAVRTLAVLAEAQSPAVKKLLLEAARVVIAAADFGARRPDKPR